MFPNTIKIFNTIYYIICKYNILKKKTLMENSTFDNDGFNSLKKFLDPSYLKKERIKCYIHPGSLTFEDDELKSLFKDDYNFRFDTYCELLSVMKNLSFSQILWYINELKIIFADNPGYKTPVIDFCYNDGSVINSKIINDKYNDKFPRFHCRENYLRWEALPYGRFCRRYFKFSSEEEMFNKIKTEYYYWNIYAVYVCCFLEGFGDYDLSLISVNNDKKILI